MSKIAGWTLSCLLAAFLVLGSASGKFSGNEAAAETFNHIGWTPATMYRVGFAEVAFAVLFLIPRTAFLGTVLLTAYFGAASAAHIRVEDAFFVPIVVSVFTWVALGLRDPRVFQIAIGDRTTVES
ncbi:MAG: DoxX family protein [Planctomycetota bacterium]